MIFVFFHDFDIEFRSNSNPVRIILLLFTLGLNFVFFSQQQYLIGNRAKNEPERITEPRDTLV